MADNYDDIINLPHHRSAKHPHMSLHDRAAQFSPFAAITGHEEAIEETARLTDEKPIISEDKAAELSDKLRLINELKAERPTVKITYFVPDERKSGGSYVTKIGSVRRIDEVAKTVIFTDSFSISIDDIMEIDSEIFKTSEWENE